LAVVGAATCVVLAYHLYRTSAQKQWKGNLGSTPKLSLCTHLHITCDVI
jgi:hypothetical protein